MRSMTSACAAFTSSWSSGVHAIEALREPLALLS